MFAIAVGIGRARPAVAEVLSDLDNKLSSLTSEAIDQRTFGPDGKAIGARVPSALCVVAK